MKPGSSKPAKIKSVKLTRRSKKIKVRFSKVSNATGYQVVYSTSKKYSKAKKKLIYKNTTTLTGLKKGKTYYVKVRAFYKKAGMKVYGSYSATKKIKVK